MMRDNESMPSSEEWSEALETNRERVATRVSLCTLVGPHGCAEWSGASTAGYAVMSVKVGGKWIAVKVSRLILALAGKLDISDPKTFACHSCDNPACVAEDHLFPGTQKANMSDAAGKGRVVVPGLSGTKHHAAKLTEDQVRFIRADKSSSRKLAARFGVAKFAILRVRNGLAYKDVK